MASHAQKTFLLLLLAAVVFNHSSQAMQLEDANDFDSSLDAEVASFSEVDADALVDRIGENEEEDPMAEADFDEDMNEDDQEEGEGEAPSFIEGEEEEMDEDELDLSGMSDEDANEIMQMLSPEEQEVFQQMLDEHKSGTASRSTEL